LTVAELQWMLWAIGFGLQYLIISALVQGPWREFSSVLVFVSGLVVTTLIDIVLQSTIGKKNYTYYLYYWVAELVRQTALLAVVVSLALSAVPEGRKRHIIRATIGVVAALFWSGSILLYREPVLNNWMTNVIRNLTFGCAVVNLGVWFTMLSRESRDIPRLMLAGGLGVQMTGEALGHSFKYLFNTPVPALVSALFIVFCHFLCLLIWWQAILRTSEERGTQMERVPPRLALTGTAER